MMAQLSPKTPTLLFGPVASVPTAWRALKQTAAGGDHRKWKVTAALGTRNSAFYPTRFPMSLFKLFLSLPQGRLHRPFFRGH